MNPILLFAGLFILTIPARTQTTLVPDANFEQALINLGYDTGMPDGSVPTGAIDTVTSLNITNLAIADITGIEDFTALEVLLASINNLTTVDLSQNTALIQASLSSNSITSIDVTQCPDLVKLLFQWNAVTSIDLSANTNLEWLLCGYNPGLTSLDLTENTALELLDCQYNAISALDLSQNTALTILNCNDNVLTQLDLSANTTLTTLRCQNNQITGLQLSQQSGLIELSCSTNQLACLNIHNGNNTNLATFTAYNNPDLTCVEVDDPIWADANFTGLDASIIFSSDCDNACSTAGLDEIQSAAYVYPNPVTSDVIFLEGAEPQSHFQLVNAVGETVLSGRLDSEQIPVAGIQPGIYFLTLTADSHSETHRIVLN